MNIKMVALDLDGTLLNSEGVISEYNKEIVRKLADSGVKVILCTGRPYLAMKRFKDQLGLKDEIICFNGAMIVDKGDKVVRNTTLDVDTCRRLVEIGIEMNAYYHSFVGERWLAPRVEEATLKYEQKSQMKYELTDFTKEDDLHFTKLLYINNPEMSQEISKKIKDEFGDKIYCALSSTTYVEILNGDSSKAKALDVLLESYGYTTDNLMTMGDGYNDLEMLHHAKMGVVMENAPIELRDQFSHRAIHHDLDGVGVYLKDFFNLKI